MRRKRRCRRGVGGWYSSKYKAGLGWIKRRPGFIFLGGLHAGLDERPRPEPGNILSE
jgi:hypothetical protein